MPTQDLLQTTELQVTHLSPRGYGVATLARPAPAPPVEVEVAHTLPRETILVEMRRKMKGTRKGRLLEVITPSPDRVETPCPHARVCGGCSWQQMAYPAQLREKEARVARAFGSHPIRPIIAATSSFRYRNKMEFTFSENRGGARYLGLMIAQAEPYVFNLEECHLSASWFSILVSAVRTWWEASGLHAYNPPRDEGTLRYLTLREAKRTGQKMAILNVSGNPLFAPTRPQLESFVAAVRGAVPGDISLFLRIHQTQKGTPTHFYEMHLGGPDHIIEELHLKSGPLSFKISPSSFFQPNTFQAERLYDAAMDLLAPLNPALVYDLYCGTGTLGMAASRFAKRVIGIDLSPESILDAEANAERNGLPHLTFHHGDVGKVLTRLLAEPNWAPPDAVIVDPPRAGLDPLALHQIRVLSPRALLYISCNPLTQAENIQQLTRWGYQVAALQPVDQFPHTPHIENVALLRRL